MQDRKEASRMEGEVQYAGFRRGGAPLPAAVSAERAGPGLMARVAKVERDYGME